MIYVTDIKMLITYSLTFVGIPYLWGGESRELGYDCSGFVIEILKAGKIDLPKDFTSHSLYNYLLKSHQAQFSIAQPGALVFYGSRKRITHVAFMIDYKRVIEAGSGDSSTVNRKIAEKQGASIRIKDLNHRNDMLEILRPAYLFE